LAVKPVVKDLIHGARRLRAAGLADHLGRNAGHGDVVRHRFGHDRARGNARAMADFDIARIFAPAPIMTP